MVPAGQAGLRPHGLLLSAARHYVIFNPASGRGRGGKRILRYQQLLRDALADVTFGETTRPGEEHDLARRACDDGFDVVVAVGGDGTWSNVADALVSSGRPDVALGILPSGTGNDFGRNFGYDPRDPGDAVQVLAGGHTRRVDVGRVDSLSASEHDPDRLEARHFLNLIGFGFDVAVIDGAAGARFLRGELLYKITALQQLFRFPGIDVELEAGAGTQRRGRQLMLTVSNGRFFGGGFPIAPDATVDDGRLHACLIGDAAPLSRLKLFNLAERGRHVGADEVEIIDDTAFRLTFPEPPRFEMDGDVRRSEGEVVEVRSLPGALAVVAPPEQAVV
ncbi:MAG: diacylglycerol kinase family lipid kinase [Longimicrobiales bacterium]|nr:diacylglycerol kinase family lipid kinase [Longimicrobiales bacterium]